MVHFFISQLLSYISYWSIDGITKSMCLREPKRVCQSCLDNGENFIISNCSLIKKRVKLKANFNSQNRNPQNPSHNLKWDYSKIMKTKQHHNTSNISLKINWNQRCQPCIIESNNQAILTLLLLFSTIIKGFAPIFCWLLCFSWFWLIPPRYFKQLRSSSFTRRLKLIMLAICSIFLGYLIRLGWEQSPMLWSYY